MDNTNNPYLGTIMKRNRPLDILKKSESLNVNPEQFIHPSTPEVVYLLGFLWADGFLGAHYSINIEIVSEDAQMIESLFDSTGKWNKFYRNRKNWKPQTKFTCSSKLLYSFLIENGFNDRTQSPDKLLSIIPEKLKHYWYRGFFDGDGCFYINTKQYLRQMSVSGNFNQDWSFMISLMSNLGINTYRVKQNSRITKTGKINSSSQVRCVNKHDITIFGNYIYSGKQFGLIRKQEKYLQIRG